MRVRRRAVIMLKAKQQQQATLICCIVINNISCLPPHLLPQSSQRLEGIKEKEAFGCGFIVDRFVRDYYHHREDQ
jgi:hypothetical protein